MEILRDNLADIASYGLLGLGLIILGFLALDLITPGNLRNLAWVEHNRNAVILATAQIIGVAWVVYSGVQASLGLELWRGVLYTFIYGVVAIALMMFSFVLIDLLTPGKLGALLLENDRHPAGWINAAVFLGVAGIVGGALGGF